MIYNLCSNLTGRFYTSPRLHLAWNLQLVFTAVTKHIYRTYVNYRILLSSTLCHWRWNVQSTSNSFAHNSVIQFSRIEFEILILLCSEYESPWNPIHWMLFNHMMSFSRKIKNYTLHDNVRDCKSKLINTS